MASKRRGLEALTGAFSAASVGSLPGNQEAAEDAYQQRLSMSMQNIKEAVSNGHLDSAKLNVEFNLASGETIITKAGFNGKVFIFQKRLIPLSSVEDLIRIAPENPRFHELMTEKDVEDILPSIITDGIETPLLAYLGGDGKIYVLDGSRRFLAYSLSKVERDLPVFLTEQQVTMQDQVVFDVKSEAKLERNMVESGYFIEKIANTRGDITNDELAILFNLHPDSIRRCRRFAALDKAVIRMAYCSTRAGVNVLTTLNKIYTSLDDQEFRQLLDYRAAYIEEHKDKLDSLISQRANQVLAKALEKKALEITLKGSIPEKDENRFEFPQHNRMKTFFELKTKNKRSDLKIKCSGMAVPVAEKLDKELESFLEDFFTRNGISCIKK